MKRWNQFVFFVFVMIVYLYFFGFSNFYYEKVMECEVVKRGVIVVQFVKVNGIDIEIVIFFVVQQFIN